MSVKRLTIPDVGPVGLYKRRGARSIKLSVKHDGEIRVSLPVWTPYSAAIDFVTKHREWIKSKQRPAVNLSSGCRVGKAHELVFVETDSSDSQKIVTKIEGNQLKVMLPADVMSISQPAQQAAVKLAKKALKMQAEQLLVDRLNKLSAEYGINYRSVRIRALKSRWGSCSAHGDITLNYFLMQLPWRMIDYVILHELTHTKVLAHSKDFWDELAKLEPDVKTIRKEIRIYNPTVTTGVDSEAQIA